jgi:hypothetical protein
MEERGAAGKRVYISASTAQRDEILAERHRALPPRLIAVPIRKWTWSEGGAAPCDGGRGGR